MIEQFRVTVETPDGSRLFLWPVASLEFRNPERLVIYQEATRPPWVFQPGRWKRVTLEVPE